MGNHLMDRFNQGLLTSNTIDKQFTPAYVTKAVVEMPKRKVFFTPLANKISMPKNHGDKLMKEVRYPMLDSRNKMQTLNIDGVAGSLTLSEIDGTNAEFIQDVLYIVDVKACKTLASFDAKNYLSPGYSLLPDGRMTQAEADGTTATCCIHTLMSDPMTNKSQMAKEMASARAAIRTDAETEVNDLVDNHGYLPSQLKVESGTGSIVNGAASFAASTTPFTLLPEEGGAINLLFSTSKMVEANITFHGVASKYTARSVDLDSRLGQVARKIKDLAEAVDALREIQIRRDLLAASKVNAMLAVPTGSAIVTAAGVDDTCVLTYDVLQQFEMDLHANDVPLDTTMLTGSAFTDTVTVPDAFIAYINREALPTLRRMTDGNGVPVWKSKEQYGSQTKPLPGEWGMIGSFRFIVVPDMEIRQGGGADTGGTTTHRRTLLNDGNEYYDVFSMVVIGDDAFTVAGIGKNGTTATHIPPTGDAHNDFYGEQGVVACKWNYGMLIYRPERIREISFTCTVN